MSWRSTTERATTGRSGTEWASKRSLRRVATIERATRTDEGREEAGTSAANRPRERLLVRCDERLIVVRLREVDWIEGDGNYVKLHEGPQVHRRRTTLAALGARLDQRRFARIHRSIWVNLDRVREIRPTESGGHEVVLRDGTALALSRSRRRRFLERLEG